MENRLILYSASVRICFFMYSSVGMGPRLTSSCTPRQRTAGQSLMVTAGMMTRADRSLVFAEARVCADCCALGAAGATAGRLWSGWADCGVLALAICSG